MSVVSVVAIAVDYIIGNFCCYIILAFLLVGIFIIVHRECRSTVSGAAAPLFIVVIIALQPERLRAVESSQLVNNKQQ